MYKGVARQTHFQLRRRPLALIVPHTWLPISDPGSLSEWHDYMLGFDCGSDRHKVATRAKEPRTHLSFGSSSQ